MAAVYVYMLTDKSRNSFVQGICESLSELIVQKDNVLPLFDSSLPMNRLVYLEKFDDLQSAQQQLHLLEISPKILKHKFVRKTNPNWLDLFFESLCINDLVYFEPNAFRVNTHLFHA